VCHGDSVAAGCTPDSKNDVSKLRSEVAKLQERATAQQAELKELRGQLAAKTSELSAIVERLSEVEKRSAPRPSTTATSDVEKRLAKLESRFDKDTLDIGTIRARTLSILNPDGKNAILLNFEEDDENGAGGRILMSSPMNNPRSGCDAPTNDRSPPSSTQNGDRCWAATRRSPSSP